MPTEQDIEQINRVNFRRALEALAHPGRPYPITPLFGSGLLALASVLLYAEVSYHYRGNLDFQMMEALTGAKPAPVDRADYLLSDRSTPDLLLAARVGSAESPETGATLVMGATRDAETVPVTLRGPGISGSLSTKLPLSQEVIGALMEKNACFPLGVDCFVVVDNSSLIGLPRTVAIEVCS